MVIKDGRCSICGAEAGLSAAAAEEHLLMVGVLPDLTHDSQSRLLTPEPLGLFYKLHVCLAEAALVYNKFLNMKIFFFPPTNPYINRLPASLCAGLGTPWTSSGPSQGLFRISKSNSIKEILKSLKQFFVKWRHFWKPHCKNIRSKMSLN